MKLLLLVCLSMLGSSVGQIVHCQDGDTECQQCNVSCNTIAPSNLPRCCEVYNSCCDTYLNDCKQCSKFLSDDPQFPEYCCARFNECCNALPSISPISISPVRTKNNEILDGNHFVFCKPSITTDAYIYIFSSILCSLGVYIVLCIFQVVYIRYACITYSSLEIFINSVLPKTEILHFALGTVGTALHFYMMSKDYGSLVSCSKWFDYPFKMDHIAELLLFLVNITFFVLMFFNWIGNRFKPQLFVTLWSTWPLAQVLMGIILETYIYAFQFIILYRCTTKMYVKTLVKLLSLLWDSRYAKTITDIFVVVIYVLIAAGFIQSCEDLTTNATKFPEGEDYVNILNIKDYIWFTYVTLTTVGYGDMSPRTTLGRSAVCITIITACVFFIQKFQELQNWIREFKFLPFYRASIPASYPRAIIVGDLKLDVITKLIKQTIDKLSEYQVILVGDKPSEDLKDLISLTYTYINFHYIIKPDYIVKQGDLLRALFNESDHEADMLIVLIDTYTGNEHEDNEVFHWITLAKEYIPNRVHFVVQVVHVKNKIIIENTLSDRKYTIICIDEITENLLFQNAKYPGSVETILNILSREQRNSKNDDANFLKNSGGENETNTLNYNRGLSFHLIYSEEKFKEDHIFKDAAKNCFLQYGILVLGSIDEQETYTLFPETLRKNTIGIFFAEKLPLKDPDMLIKPSKTPANSSSTGKIEITEFIPKVAVLVLSGEEAKYQTFLKNIDMEITYIYNSHKIWLQSHGYAGINSLVIMDNILNDTEILYYINLFYTIVSKHPADIAKPYITYQLHEENACIAMPLTSTDDCAMGNLDSTNLVFSFLEMAINNHTFFTEAAILFHSTNGKISAMTVEKSCSYGALFTTLLEKDQLLIGIRQCFNANYGIRTLSTFPSSNVIVKENDLAIIVKL